MDDNSREAAALNSSQALPTQPSAAEPALADAQPHGRTEGARHVITPAQPAGRDRGEDNDAQPKHQPGKKATTAVERQVPLD